MQTIHISQAIPGALQKSEVLAPEVLVKLLPSEVAIVTASIPTEKNVRVESMDADALVTFAQQIRREIVLRLGLKIQSEEDEAEIVTGLSKAIFKHKLLTRREIQIAVDKALDGDFLKENDGFVHFTLTNFSLWIKTYIQETKSPVMKKHAQLKHQEEKPKPAPAPYQQFQGAIDIINMYLDLRKTDPEHRAMAAAPLYVEAVEFGIIVPDREEKRQIWNDVLQAYPKKGNSFHVDMARNIAYNRYIDSLLEYGYRLGADGKVIEDTTNE